MSFQLRLLDLSEYRSIVLQLDRVAAGDRQAWRDLVSRCSDEIASAEFLQWNGKGSGAGLAEVWRTELFRSQGAPVLTEKLRKFGEMAVALCAMPSFQYSRYFGADPSRPSPSLVTLGEGDGGLFDILGRSAGWLENMFQTRFSEGTERYAVGDAMFVLDADALRLLRNLVRGGELAGLVIGNDYAGDTLSRLVTLVERAVADERYAIAVSCLDG